MKFPKKILVFILSLIVFSIPFLYVNVNAINNGNSIVYENVDYDYSQLQLNIPDNYYDSLDMNDNYDDFSDELCAIISSNYVQYTYDAVSKILHLSDVDPENTDNIIGLYSGLSLSGGWNREHVWCKSHGFSGEQTYLPYTDAHHLRATNANINSTRNNSDYGEVNHATASSDIYGNYWTSDTYEPRDKVKGDCARMILYVAIRYRNTSPYYAEIIEGSSLDYLTSNGKTVFGNLSTLLKWHYEDPVSLEEIYRNNIVYSFQKNRNPFIDHPEYVEKCWDVSDVLGYDVDVYVNNDEITTLENKISSINSIVSLSDNANVNKILEAYELYGDLNNNEKEELDSQYFDKLVNALEDYRELKQASKNNEYIKTLNFKDVTAEKGGAYNTDISSTVDGMNVYITHAYYMSACYAKQISLGYNNNNSISSLNLNFILNNTYGDYVKISSNLQNIKKIDVYTPAVYRDVSYFKGWYIAYGNDTDGYDLGGSGTIYQNHFVVDFDEAISGDILFIITGSKACISLETMTFELENENSNTDPLFKEINEISTKAQLAYSYNVDTESTSVTLPNEQISFVTDVNIASAFGYDDNKLDIRYIKNNQSNSNVTTSLVKLYKNDILQITCVGEITSISFVKASGTDYNPQGNAAISFDGVEYTTISQLTDIPIGSNVFYLKALNSQIRFTDLTINYGGIEINNMKMRFGALLSYDLWCDLLENYDVTGYGVFLAKSNDIETNIVNKFNEIKEEIDINTTLEDLLDSNNINYEARLCDDESNLSICRANSDGSLNENGDYVVFNALLSSNMNHKDDKIKAVAYIILDGEYVFLGERDESYKSVAKIYVDSNNYNGTLLTSLQYLAN